VVAAVGVVFAVWWEMDGGRTWRSNICCL
jgi:hypothetical protein